MGKRKIKFNPLAVFLGAVLITYTLILFFFIFYDFYSSLKTRIEFRQSAISFPSDWFGGFANYAEALDAVKMEAATDQIGVKRTFYLEDMFLNSLGYALGCSFTATLVPCLVAYVTAKYRFRFNSVLYMTVIFVMVTPIVGSAPSQIYVMDELFGIYNSFFGMWFMTANFLGTYYLVFYGIFKGLSWEYAEAAFIDGASHLNVMVRVMFPLIRTTFGVVMLLNFIGYWNDYSTPLLFMPKYPTAAMGVQFFQRAADNKYKAHVPIRLAASVLLMAPVLITFVLFRNKLAGNLTVGGIKG